MKLAILGWTTVVAATLAVALWRLGPHVLPATIDIVADVQLRLKDTDRPFAGFELYAQGVATRGPPEGSRPVHFHGVQLRMLGESKPSDKTWPGFSMDVLIDQQRYSDVTVWHGDGVLMPGQPGDGVFGAGPVLEYMRQVGIAMSPVTREEVTELVGLVRGLAYTNTRQILPFATKHYYITANVQKFPHVSPKAYAAAAGIATGVWVTGLLVLCLLSRVRRLLH